MAAQAVVRLPQGTPAKKINLHYSRFLGKYSKCLKDETLALGDDIFNGDPVVLDME